MNVLSLAKSIKSRVEEPVGDFQTMVGALGNPQIPLMLALSKVFVEPTYRVTFLASAVGSGVLGWLGTRPCDLDSLAQQLEVAPEDRERLRAWLEIGVELGDLGKSAGCYHARSIPAKALAQADNDAVAAALEEVMRFHVPALLNAPDMLRERRKFTLNDQDGAIIARSTRVIQSFVEQAVGRTLDRGKPIRLLEVGCGSGVYVRQAAELNPRLSALAIDMQKEVVDQAARNMVEWGISDRVETRQGDLRDLDLEPQFDLITLHNNIYYFPEDERTEALRRVRSLLAPGGKILLTTSCQGGNIGLEVLGLWFSNADFGGPLPREEQLVEQMESAGFSDVTANQIIPGEKFRAFVGIRTHLV